MEHTPYEPPRDDDHLPRVTAFEDFLLSPNSCGCAAVLATLALGLVALLRRDWVAFG
jgi:hypothetical protein